MNKKLKKYFIGTFIVLGLLFLWGGFQGSSQVPPAKANSIIAFDSGRWAINAKESKVENYLGRKSLYLKEGLAFIKDSNFTDGIIEYDVALTQELGFIGVIWRMQNIKNFEEFYLRSLQSEKPDATQYNPIYNDVLSWQLYSGENYSAPAKYVYNQWMHVKVVVSGKNAEMYIQDMDKPVLFVELKRENKPGKVGLIVIQDSAPGHFSNFSYTSQSNPPLKGKLKAKPDVSKGAITSWLVSNTFDEKSLDGQFRLTENDKQKLTWQKLASEPSGRTNLAILNEPKEGQNTGFARTTIISEKQQLKPLEFGFANRVKVYCNDQLLYSGNDDFGSRDYRFMGTMGYFDEVSLPLKKGKNELWMAVSETFPVNGWGLQARFKDMDGISVTQ